MKSMSRSSKNLAFVASILIFLAIACDGGSRISGHVYDPHERPISNANVLFEAVEKGSPAESYQDESTSDESGRFHAGFTHAPYDVRLRLTVTKTGYKPYVSEFKASDAAKMNEDKHELIVIMEVEPKD
jgi:hypothetical protein